MVTGEQHQNIRNPNSTLTDQRKVKPNPWGPSWSVVCLPSSQVLSPVLAATPGRRSVPDRRLVNCLWMRGWLLGSSTRTSGGPNSTINDQGKVKPNPWGPSWSVVCLLSSQVLSPDLAAAPGRRSGPDRRLVNLLWMRGWLLGSSTRTSGVLTLH